MCVNVCPREKEESGSRRLDFLDWLQFFKPSQAFGALK